VSPLLQATNIRKRYAGAIEALAGISFSVERGELVAIVGPSGSGKTTLLHILGTLDRPTAGSISIYGVDVTDLSDHQLCALRARAIGFVFQQFFLLEARSALDNVAVGLLYSGTALGERRARAEEALMRVGLRHRLHQRPHTLSGESGSGSQSRAQSCTGRASSSPMSRPGTSIPTPAPRSSNCSAACTSKGRRS
jgi:putative ABC transport system ATP-binding protein